MYTLTAIQIEEDKRDAAAEAEYLSREEYYFWNRTDADGAEHEAYYLSVLAKQDAELAAWVKANAWMDSL